MSQARVAKLFDIELGGKPTRELMVLPFLSGRALQSVRDKSHNQEAEGVQYRSESGSD